MAKIQNQKNSDGAVLCPEVIAFLEQIDLLRSREREAQNIHTNNFTPLKGWRERERERERERRMMELNLNNEFTFLFFPVKIVEPGEKYFFQDNI